MKLISAIIKSYKLEAIQEAIGNLGFGLTAIEVKGFGRQQGHTELYRGIEYSVEFVPKTKIEVAVDDSKLEEVIDTISSIARTGKIGDGKIFVYELNDAVRIHRRIGRKRPVDTYCDEPSCISGDRHFRVFNAA